MDRQTVVAHSKLEGGVTSLITGQHIHRGPGGAVSRIDTFDATAAFSASTGAFVGAPSRIQAFGYDANARLQSEKEYKATDIAAFLGNPNAAATKAITYGYDDVGNRTSKTLTTAAGTETTAYVYDTSDRLQTETLNTSTGSSVVTTYGWDGNGNLQSKTSPSDYTGYVFDADNRLIEVRKGISQATATTVATYGYDADGQRIRKTTPTDNATTHFLIDPTTTWPQVVLEKAVTPASTQHTAYVWGDQLRQQVRGGQGSLFGSPAESLVPVQGHLNTTIAAVTPQATVAEAYESSAFGELVNSNPRAAHQYTGEYWDSSAESIYLRERWLRPFVAHFLTIDPFTGLTEDPKSLAKYTYAALDPINNVDPSGMMTISEAMTALNNLASSIRTALPNVNQVRQLSAKACHIAAGVVRPFEELSGRLLRGTDYQAHHILQNAVMMENAQRLNLIYSRMTDFSVPLFGGTHIKGSPHHAATVFQRNNTLSRPSFNQVLAHAFRALRTVGCRRSDATTIVDMARSLYELDQRGILP